MTLESFVPFAAMDQGPRGWGTPLYERVAERAGVGRGSAVLDVGCGSGTFCRLAADRGARVAGIDADRAAIAEAAALVPEGSFRVGDMQALADADDRYDVVTGFQSFFQASRPLQALREARRVTRPGGVVAMTAWGPEERCDIRAITDALAPLLARPERGAPPRLPGDANRRPAVPLLGEPGRMERMAERAGLTPQEDGEVVCTFVYPDEDSLVASVLASAPGRLAARRAGPRALRRHVLDGLAGFRAPGGSYRLDNAFRYVIARA